MGLMVLASPDVQIAPVSPGASDTAPPDAFGSLLSTLLGQTASDSAVPVNSGANPLLPSKSSAEDDPATSAAVLEAMAMLQALVGPAALLPRPQTTDIGAPVQVPDIALAGAESGGAPSSTMAAIDDQALSAAPDEPVEPSNDPAIAASGPSPAGESPTAPPSAVAPAGNQSSGASGSAVTTSAGFTAVLETRTQQLGEHEKRAKNSAGEAVAPPGDPPPTGTQPASSVVRSVGNANENSAESNGDAPGHQEQKPRPKASVDGVAHSGEHSVLHRTDDPGVPATDAPRPPVRPEMPPAVEQVVRTVIEKAGAGGGEAKLHLHPAELGEIIIHVHADGDSVQVRVHAERPEAAQLIREHTVDLSSMLGQQGLNLADVNVSLGHPGSGDAGAREQGPTSNRPGESDFAALMGIGDTTATDRFNRVRAAYNPNGAFDYRI